MSLEQFSDGFRTGYSMLRTFLCCSLAFVAMTMPLRCQDLAPQPHVIEGNIKVPGTDYAVVLGAGSRQSDSASREALVDAIKTWLSIQFALAAIDRQPRIEFVPSSKIAVLRVNALLPIQQSIKDDGRSLLNTTLSPSTTTLLKQYIWPTTGLAALRPSCRCWSMKWFIISKICSGSNMNVRKRVKRSLISPGAVARPVRTRLGDGF